VTVQEPFAGTVPVASARLLPLLAAVTVPPAQLVAPEAEAELTRPAGYVSVKAAPVTAAAFGFVSVMVRTEAPPVPMADAENAFATVSAEFTVSDPLPAAVLAPALEVVRPPAAMLLAYVPTVAEVTFTVTVQEPFAGIVAPESATLVPLLAAVTVPPAQVVAPEAEAVFTRLAG